MPKVVFAHDDKSTSQVPIEPTRADFTALIVYADHNENSLRASRKTTA